MKLTLISAILLVILILYDFSITQPQVQNTTSYENIQFSSNIMCYMQQHIVFKHMYLNSPKRISKNHILYIFALLLFNSSDCHPNPIVSLGVTEASRNTTDGRRGLIRKLDEQTDQQSGSVITSCRRRPEGPASHQKQLHKQHG